MEIDMAEVKSEKPKTPVDKVTGTPPATAPAKKEKKIESKAERFFRLANARVNAAIKRLGYIRALANRSQYEYTAEQADAINEALTNEVRAISNAFDGQTKEKAAFTL